MKLNLAVLQVIHEVAANLFLGISVILDHLFPGFQGFPFHTCKAICHLSASFQTAMTLPLSEDNIRLSMSLRHLILKKLMDLALKVSQFHRKALSQNFTNLFDKDYCFYDSSFQIPHHAAFKISWAFFPLLLHACIYVCTYTPGLTGSYLMQISCSAFSHFLPVGANQPH